MTPIDLEIWIGPSNSICHKWIKWALDESTRLHCLVKNEHQEVWGGLGDFPSSWHWLESKQDSVPLHDWRADNMQWTNTSCQEKHVILQDNSTGGAQGQRSIQTSCLHCMNSYEHVHFPAIALSSSWHPFHSRALLFSTKTYQHEASNIYLLRVSQGRQLPARCLRGETTLLVLPAVMVTKEKAKEKNIWTLPLLPLARTCFEFVSFFIFFPWKMKNTWQTLHWLAMMCCWGRFFLVKKTRPANFGPLCRRTN